MNILCEMLISDFFKFSKGDTVLVGEISSNFEEFIFKSKADVYIGENKIKTINLVGEERYVGGDLEKRRGKRAVRTNDDISLDSDSINKKMVKLVIYCD